MVYFQDENLRGIKTIQVCRHCGSEVKKDVEFCLFCNTAEKRAQTDKENKEIFSVVGLNYQCKFCKPRHNA